MTQSVVRPRAEELVLQLWEQGYFARFPIAEEFFAPLSTRDLKMGPDLPTDFVPGEAKILEPPLPNSDVPEISL